MILSTIFLNKIKKRCNKHLFPNIHFRLTILKPTKNWLGNEKNVIWNKYSGCD
jgi:hypothetical protein